MTMKLADDCFFHDKDRMPHDEALAILKSRVRPVVDVESIDMHAAQGRYLAEPVLSATGHTCARQRRSRRLCLQPFSL